MTTSDIQAKIEHIYGITISPSIISKIADKIIALPLPYLDGMYFKVRSNRKIVNKAVYICLVYTMEECKYILGI